MSLVAGTRLGPYEIQAAIGAGGMGEVYKARDTRLDRTVAIKVLPAELSSDPERRARFEREAKTIAGLTHPHICTLYDVGEHDGTTFLVMEHLAGQTLADRLLKGPVPLPQALDVAAQIADALDAAHKHGIIHRDLKPGNVMLTAGGSGRSGAVSAKLLDFGLAKLAAHGERPALGTDVSAATRSLPMTARGTIVGTLQYMAPEQLEGKEADARTDLWALGALLYEMVTGRRAFQADSDVSLIGAILNTEPAGLATLQPLTPPSLERLVTRCLAKHPDDRWDTAHDVADELRWIAQSSSSFVAVPGPQSKRRRWLARTGWAAGTATIAVLAALVGAEFGMPGIGPPPGGATKTVAHLAVLLPPDAPVWTSSAAPPSLALSPDGAIIAYTCSRTGGSQICVRRLSQTTVTPLAGTEGGRSPAFSPDGSWLVFCVAVGGVRCQDRAPVKKVSLRDGHVESLGTLPYASRWSPSFAWDADGSLLVSGDGGLWTLPSGGGPPTALLSIGPDSGDFTYNNAQWLPGRQRIIYSVVTTSDRAEVRVFDLATRKQQLIQRDAGGAWYVPSGYLVFQQANAGYGYWSIMASTFDPVSLTLGSPVQVLEDAGTVGLINERPLTIAVNGTALYLAAESNRILTWVDRQQRTIPVLGQRGPWAGPQLSPDGGVVAVNVLDPAGWRVALVDVSRGTATDVVSNAWSPVWMPDGERITVASLKLDRLLSQRADGTGTPEVLYQSERGETAFSNGSWSRDGVLAFSHGIGWPPIETLFKEGSVWVARDFFPLNRSAASPRFSPDGRWIAYTSDESQQRFDVYVRAYPGAGQRTQVSVGGGYDAVWSKDGRELFYRDGDRFYAVPVTLGGTFSAGVPKLLFTGPYLDTGIFFHSYDVSPDGQRFLVVQVSDEERAPRRFHLVQNWFEELKAKVPAGGAGK